MRSLREKLTQSVELWWRALGSTHRLSSLYPRPTESSCWRWRMENPFCPAWSPRNPLLALCSRGRWGGNWRWFQSTEIFATLVKAQGNVEFNSQWSRARDLLGRRLPFYKRCKKSSSWSRSELVVCSILVELSSSLNLVVICERKCQKNWWSKWEILVYLLSIRARNFLDICWLINHTLNPKIIHQKSQTHIKIILSWCFDSVFTTLSSSPILWYWFNMHLNFIFTAFSLKKLKNLT